MKQTKVADRALILSDTGASVNNGVGKFVSIFEQRLNSQYDEVIVCDPESFLNFLDELEAKPSVRYDLYVNAYNSKSDLLFRTELKKRSVLKSIIPKKIIISHGWTRMKFRWNLYSIHYFIKYQILNKRSLNSIMLCYDEVLFINSEEDNYRHKDKKFIISGKIPHNYYDFASDYIEKLRTSTNIAISENGGILVIANKQAVKNLYSLFMPGFHFWIHGQGFGKITLLCQSCANSWFLKMLCRLYKIKLITDNSLKNKLLSGCQILYIPSHTEYQPLTALEAFALNKQVVSRNRITGLNGFSLYSFRRE